MSYAVRLRRSAQKDLDALRGRDYEAIARAVRHLAEDPRPPRVNKLAVRDLWRIRVGQYRIVYSIDDEAQQVPIVRVARRNEDTYRRL